MPMMDVGHMPVLVFRARMLMFMRVSHVSRIMNMQFIVPVPVFMHHRHVDVEVGMLFIRQQQGAGDHQGCGKDEQ